MADAHLPEYAGRVIRMIERLRTAGIEPTGVDLPCTDVPESLTGIATFYGLPVRWSTEETPSVRIEVR